MFKWLVWALIGITGFAYAVRNDFGPGTEIRRDLYLRQLGNDDNVPQAIRADYSLRNWLYVGGIFWVIAGGAMLVSESRSKEGRVD